MLLVPSVPPRVKDGTRDALYIYIKYCIQPVESTAEFKGEFDPSCHRRRRGQPSFKHLAGCLLPLLMVLIEYRENGEPLGDEAQQQFFLLAAAAQKLLFPPIHQCHLPQWREENRQGGKSRPHSAQAKECRLQADSEGQMGCRLALRQA